jgi:hypothetical protein
VRLASAYGILLSAGVVVTQTWCTDTVSCDTRRQRQQAACQNMICANDQVPQHAESEVVFKRGGRWFAAPSEYFDGNGNPVFYWPGAKPGFGKSNANAETDNGRVNRYPAAAIEIFIVMHDGQEETFEKIRAFRSDTAKVDVGSGLHVLNIARSASAFPGTYLWPPNVKTTLGNPPVLRCTSMDKDMACGSELAWKPGLWVFVRFSGRHAYDWIPIYFETIRLLNLVREA